VRTAAFFMVKAAAAGWWHHLNLACTVRNKIVFDVPIMTYLTKIVKYNFAKNFAGENWGDARL
jgi:hypothetical protein